MDSVGIHRYQLTVIASSMVDLVGSAGGWIYDRSRAGWEVKVVLPERHDTRPLAILGASVLDIDRDSELVRLAAHSGALAISAAVLAADEGLRSQVLKVLKRGRIDVMVWGQDWPAEFSRRVDPVEHRLSAAARAFKAHALGAVMIKRPVAGSETLFSLGADSFRRLYSV
jgi:hypothetical protein